MEGGMSDFTTDPEQAWDTFARRWRRHHPKLAHIGDEWTGQASGTAESLEQVQEIIESEFIAPYIEKNDTVLEIGVGGGRTAALLVKHCSRLVCADISAQMLKETRKRLGAKQVSYVKLDGVTMSGMPPGSFDVCFCLDTMVHMDPRDIFNYLAKIPTLLRGKRLCLFHHTNVLSPNGWEKFLSEWEANLKGQRSPLSFSVMTNSIMERFLTHLGYEIIRKDADTVPRDCVWVCKAPPASA